MSCWLVLVSGSGRAWWRVRKGVVILTYPVREVDLALLGGELKHARVRDAVLLAVDELEEHGVGDVQAGELLEGAGR